MTPDDHQPFRFAVLAADTALFTLKGGSLLVRLIRVDRPPHYDGTPGLPGGLLDPSETAEEAALRHLKARTGVRTEHVYIEQLATFSKVDRDKRGRVVAVTYLACVPWDRLSTEEQTDTDTSWWSPANAKAQLAYDHSEVLALALKRLASRVSYTTLLGKLMPEEFTLTELEQAYECVLGTPLDKRNFRKKILKLDVLEALDKKRSGGRSRPAQLYSFKSGTVEEIEVL